MSNDESERLERIERNLERLNLQGDERGAALAEFGGQMSKLALSIEHLTTVTGALAEQMTSTVERDLLQDKHIDELRAELTKRLAPAVVGGSGAVALLLEYLPNLLRWFTS